jgi:hypothetical protein
MSLGRMIANRIALPRWNPIIEDARRSPRHR